MVANVSEAVGMQFGLRKCSVAHVIGGKVIDGDEVMLNSGGIVKSEGKQGSYKYLGGILQTPEEDVEFRPKRHKQDEGKQHMGRGRLQLEW